jgi:hypothetical protein
MSSDQRSEASTGCCIGQAEIVADGLGLPNSVRPAAAIENSQSALQSLAQTMSRDSGYLDAHRAMHERVDAVLPDEKMPLADRVRMAGAIGFVMGIFGLAAGKAFRDVAADELRTILIEAINDILRVG